MDGGEAGFHLSRQEDRVKGVSSLKSEFESHPSKAQAARGRLKRAIIDRDPEGHRYSTARSWLSEDGRFHLRGWEDGWSVWARYTGEDTYQEDIQLLQRHDLHQLRFSSLRETRERLQDALELEGRG